MSLCIPCKHCGKFQASHPKLRHPADRSAPAVHGACEKYESINDSKVREQNFLRHCRYSWIQILDGNVGIKPHC